MFSISLDKTKQQATIQSDHLDLIREHFSVPNPMYGRNNAWAKFTPRRLYTITPTGKFDIGLYGNIVDFLKLEGYNVPEDEREIYNYYKPSINFINIPSLKYILRDYQYNSVECALKSGRGVIVLPTAAGKTLTIASLIASIEQVRDDYNFLLIVPSIQLIKQTYNDFIEYGIDKNLITKWSGDDTPDLNCKIVIAGSHILLNQYKTYENFLKRVNVVIIDECHGLRKGNKLNNIIKLFNTPNRFGFTGTMPSDKIDQWNIIGKIGPILYEEKSIDLRDNKQIANALIQILEFTYTTKPVFSSISLSNPTKVYDEELEFLINSKERNDKISTICNKTDKNTLVMVERINHGEILFNTIKQACPTKEVFFIQGSVDVTIREQIRSIMEEKNNVVCIAISKVFSTGINIKNLHYIVFAASGKAKIKILQSIGRGLRLHPSKTLLVIFDIADNLRYGMKHLKERIKLYDTEKIQYKTTQIQIG